MSDGTVLISGVKVVRNDTAFQFLESYTSTTGLKGSVYKSSTVFLTHCILVVCVCAEKWV